jgi:hypothetical protein
MNILSLDWDYFVDASAVERATLFPVGNSDPDNSMSYYVWAFRYAGAKFNAERNGTRAIETIGCLDADIDSLETFVGNFCAKGTPCLVCESHTGIVRLLDNPPKENFTVYNVDFHHDCYGKKDELNCGNWGRILRKSGMIDRLVWVRRADSDSVPVGVGRRSGVEGFIRAFKDVKIDAIFICRSGMWSPPHLDSAFINMVNRLCSACSARYRILGDVHIRWNGGLRGAIADLNGSGRLLQSAVAS